MSSEDPRIAIIQQKLAEAKMHPAERDAVSCGRPSHACDKTTFSLAPVVE